jgi:hypothetical protein
MFRSHVRWTGWLLVLSAAGLACTRLPPPHTDEGSTRVDRILEEKRGKDDLTRFAGRAPSVCVLSTATTELCEWQLGNRHAGWAPLAAAIDTTDQVNLICELPSDGGPRASRSRIAYPRRSNRGRFPIPTASSTRRGQRSESPTEARERYRRQTNRALEAARTLLELVHLVGAAPNECSRQSSALQVCLWRATNRTYGHGTLAMSIGAPKGKRVRMQCQLPTDGSDRAPDSCRVEVGG